MKNKTTQHHLFALASVFALVGLPAPGLAQSAQNCAPRAIVVDRLNERYGESRQSVGLTHSNTMIEVFASTDTGSWTITATQANGMTCLVASGQSFEAIQELTANQDDAA